MRAGRSRCVYGVPNQTVLSQEGNKGTVFIGGREAHRRGKAGKMVCRCVWWWWWCVCVGACKLQMVVAVQCGGGGRAQQGMLGQVVVEGVVCAGGIKWHQNAMLCIGISKCFQCKKFAWHKINQRERERRREGRSSLL